MRTFVTLSFALVLALGYAATAAADPTPSPAETSISLAVGQSITLERQADGTLIVATSSGDAVSLSEVERAMADAVQSMPNASGPNAARITAPAGSASEEIVPGRLKIRLLSQDGATILAIDNGLDHALRYRATMHRGLQSAPTDVCVVLPHLHGYEHWPFEFDSIDLLNMELQEWREGDQVTCQ